MQFFCDKFIIYFLLKAVKVLDCEICKKQRTEFDKSML